MTGLLRPKKIIPGSEFAGVIEAIGKNISGLKVDERVFGFDDQGAESQAQYMTIGEDRVMTIPENVTFEQAAASTEGAHYAYNFINKVSIKKGQNVLVNGATGAIGSAAVQLLKYFDINVTAVCSTKNVELVRSLGAHQVIDYKKEDFTKTNQQYHFVFDTVGKSSFFKCRHLLKPEGVYISSDLGFMAQNLYLPLVTSLTKSLMGNRRTAFPMPLNIKETLLLVKKLMEQEKYKAVIDKTYSLENISEAYRYVIQGHKLGNVVITVGHN